MVAFQVSTLRFAGFIIECTGWIRVIRYDPSVLMVEPFGHKVGVQLHV